MNDFDPNVAMNMPDSPPQSFWGKALGALGSAGTEMKTHPERTSIALDMLGKGFDPDNPFAGIGTALGKSSLASKAEAAGQKSSHDMFQQLLKALTPGDKPGPTSFSASLGKDGMDYNIKGIEGIETPTKLSGVKSETRDFFTDDDFVSNFGERGSEGGF